MAHERIQPEGLFQSGPLGFTQVVASAPGRTIHISGQVGCDEKGQPVSEELVPQAEAAVANLKLALSAAGATPADLTMLRVYIVDYTPAVAGPVGRAIAQLYDGGEPAASTWVGVSALFMPAYKIEIEAVAVV